MLKAGRQTNHDFLNTDPKWMLSCIEREASIFFDKNIYNV